MGVDYYECCDCGECLYDCWEYCSCCHECLGQDGLVCKDCFDVDKYDKHRLEFRSSKSLEFKFRLCGNCIEDTDIDGVYDGVTYYFSSKKFDEDKVRESIPKEYFIKTIEYQKERYYSNDAKIKELELKITNNDKEICNLVERNEKLRQQTETLTTVSNNL